MPFQTGSQLRLTHGHSRRGKKSTEYVVWNSMKNRCYNPKVKSYPSYGGRGIKVCNRWMKFENFLADMGERPAGMTLDRKDNSGDYTPINCKWSTPKEQAANRRVKRNAVTYQGRSAKEWAAEWGIIHTSAIRRIHTLLDKAGV